MLKDKGMTVSVQTLLYIMLCLIMPILYINTCINMWKKKLEDKTWVSTVMK